MSKHIIRSGSTTLTKPVTIKRKPKPVSSVGGGQVGVFTGTGGGGER